jgi:hypothetical protein
VPAVARERRSSPRTDRRRLPADRHQGRGGVLPGSMVSIPAHGCPVESRNILGTYPADALVSERLFCVCDRRAIRTDSRRLTLERGEPAVGPLTESDRRSWAIDAVFDGGRQAMQRDLSLLAISSDSLLVRVLTDTYDDVVERALRAGTALRGLMERCPNSPKSAPAGVVRLQARHACSGRRPDPKNWDNRAYLYDINYVIKIWPPSSRLTSWHGAPTRWSRGGGRATRRESANSSALHCS